MKQLIFLMSHPGKSEKRIIEKLKPLSDVGLGLYQDGTIVKYTFGRRKPES